jgi:hypothetical protein
MGTRFYSSVEYGSSRMGADADCVYYNANIINNSTKDAVGNQADPQVSFSESRQIPILREPGDYMMSIIDISYIGATQNLPIFIPRIQGSLTTAEFYGTISANEDGSSTLNVQQIASGSIIQGTLVEVPSIPNSSAKVAGGNTIPGYTGAGGVGTYKLTDSNIAPFTGRLYMVQVVPQNDPNLTIYSVSVQNTATQAVARFYLEWLPINQYALPPPVPVINQNLGSDYYYCYTYQSVLDMFNAAYTAACTAVGVTPTAGMQLSYGQDTRTDPIFLMALPTGANVFMNTALETLFSNFPGVYLNQTLGRSFQFLPSPNTTGLQPIDGVLSVQNYGSTSSWTPVVSLSVTSNLLPINLEQCATPADVGSSSINTLGSISPGTYLPVVADNTIDTSARGAGALRQSYINEPMAEFRMISITNTQAPINQIDFQVWWRNRLDNNLYPLRLVSGSSVSLKVLFRRKQMGV